MYYIAFWLNWTFTLCKMLQHRCPLLQKWEHSSTWALPQRPGWSLWAPPVHRRNDISRDFRDADYANQQTSLKHRAPVILMSRRFACSPFGTYFNFSYFIIFLDHGVMVSLIFAAHPPSRRSRPRCVDQLLEAQLSCSNRPTWTSEPCWVFRVFPPSDSIFHTVFFHV